MPKKTAQKIIDSRRGNRTTTISGVTLTAPAPGVSDHGLLIGLADDDHPQYLLADGSRTLSGNLAVAASVTIDGVDLSAHAADPAAHHAPVTAGSLISLSGQQVSVAAGSAQYQVPMTGVSPFTPAWAALADMAGAGLTFGSGAFAIGAGTLLTVGADAVGITTGANYQFIGTGSGTAAAWQDVSGLAGNGLSHSAGVLAVGVSGLGLGVGADAVTLASSSNPGAAASILASSAAGLLQLVQVASNETFASGFAGSGYRVDYGVSEALKASAEVDNLTVRGRMRVYELLIQQIRATNGSVFVTSTGKAKAVSASSNPAWTVNGEALTFNGEAATLTTTIYTITTSDSTEDAGDKALYHGFLVGDIIRAQQVEWNGSAFAGVIQSNLEVTGVTNLYTFTAARVATGDSAAAVGYDYVRLGNASDTTRQGSVYITSDDSNAPYIDVVDTVASHAQWNTAGKVKARLGKLSGISDSYFGTLSGYGLYSDNVYLRGSIYATDGVFSGTVYATDGIFSGTVYASAGSIGGWTIASGRLTNDTGTAATSAGLSPADYPFYAGQTYASRATAPFRVTPAGALTATSGAVGGWTLGASALTAGSGSNTVGLDAGGTNPAIYAGSATPGSAPFRVTKAGVLYAEGADIRGAITASSGSLTGFLTIGTDGGIYQGSGTAGAPDTGLKIWNVGGYGMMAGYYDETIQWFSSSTGQLFTGYRSGIDKWSQRFASDGVRFYLEESSSVNIPTNSSALRWVAGSVNDTVGGAYNYTGIIGYRNTSANVVDSITTSYVGSGSYTTQTARTILQAGNYDGSTYRDAYFYVSKAAGAAGVTNGHLQADYFSFSGYMLMTEISAPSAPAGDTVVLYAEDNGSGKTRLMAKFASGSAVQIAIQP